MKKRGKLEITYRFLDGRTMTETEFFAEPYLVTYENNPDLPERAAQVFNKVSVAQRSRYNYELTKARKERLLAELAKVDAELKNTAR